ncbi:hypothetical protein PR002_g14466 [Phytophthora rubi]|uniref:Uncharacterized protein n=1 Tax=Phytophthora rubi TaxID=129364 RepID=A0A6A3L1S6_9STRA|nr:hypothetical protein PR002_g14466 [Phytophthora rubi]
MKKKCARPAYKAWRNWQSDDELSRIAGQAASTFKDDAGLINDTERPHEEIDAAEDVEEHADANSDEANCEDANSNEAHGVATAAKRTCEGDASGFDPSKKARHR